MFVCSSLDKCVCRSYENWSDHLTSFTGVVGVTGTSSATILAALLLVACSATIDLNVEGTLDAIDKVGVVPGRSILNVHDIRSLLVHLLGELCLRQVGLRAPGLDGLGTNV